MVKVTAMGNEIICNYDDFYISYQPSPPGFALMLDTMLGAGDNLGRSETAICVKDGKFYILYGDHRKQYAKLAPKGLNACLKYFRQHPESKSHASD